MAALPAGAQTASTPPAPVPAVEPPAPTTEEGIALTTAAFATIGFPLPPDQVEEVRKQLSGYPSDFGKVRKMHLANGIAPNSHVSPPILASK